MDDHSAKDGAIDLTTTGADSETLKGLLLDGRYRITELLGEGSMGRVYSGVQMSLARKVAIKVIREEVSNDPQLRRRFLDEAKTLAGFSHPNIVGLVDFGESEAGMLYCVLEYVEGVPLGEAVDGRQMNLDFVLVLGSQIAAALSEAHSRNVIHRDLKPDNVFVTRAAHGALRFRLLDFGISRSVQTQDLTVEEGIYGTPTYISPEQAKARPPVVQSDFYALGVVLYELLTAQALFEFRSVVQVVLSHANEAAPDVRELRPDIPADVAEFLNQLLSKRPSERPANAVELMLRFEDLMEEHGVRSTLRADSADVTSFVHEAGFASADETLLDGFMAPKINDGLFESSDGIEDIFAPDTVFDPNVGPEDAKPPQKSATGTREIEFEEEISVELEDAGTVVSQEIPRDQVDNVIFGMSGSGELPELDYGGLEFSSVVEDPAPITPPVIPGTPDKVSIDATASPEAPERPVFVPRAQPRPEGPPTWVKIAAVGAVLVLVLGGVMVFGGSEKPEPNGPKQGPTIVAAAEPKGGDEVVIEAFEPTYVLPDSDETKAIVFGLLKKAGKSSWQFRGEGIQRSSTEETSSFVLERGGEKVMASFTFASDETLDGLPEPSAPEVSYRHPQFVVFLGPVNVDRVPYDVRAAMKP